MRNSLLPIAICLATLATPAAGQEPGPAAVAIAARDLPRATVLERDDVRFQGGAAEGESLRLGWVTRRVIRAGEVLEPPAIAPAAVVHAGEQVQAVWQEGPLQLRLLGRAMNSAAAGEQVRVRIDMQRTFQGSALPSGTVRLDSPQPVRDR